MAIKQTAELERILKDAADRKASDVFLIPGEPVSYRIDGKVVRDEGDPLRADEIRSMAVAAIGEDALDRIGTRVGEVRTSCGLPGVIDAKLTVARSMGDFTVAIAVMIQTAMSPEECGIKPDVVKAIEEPHGLVLISGRMGSGKTTVAYALLEHLNATRPCHIVTVEDPIAGYITPKQALVQQREVGSDVPDVVSGIRAAMRQDPDAIMIGELKTLEGVDAALTAAAMGHMVIIVMNVPRAVDAIQRLIDVQPVEHQAAFRKMLARELRAASAQCLVRRANKPGRAAAYDVLIPDDNTREAIIAGKDLDGLPLPEGSIRLADDLKRMQDEGIITEEIAKQALA